MLWQLFVPPSNHFSRTLDRNRLHAPDEGSLLERVKALAGDTSIEESNGSRGIPRRYLACIRRRRLRAHFALLPEAGHGSGADRTPRHAPWILPDAAAADRPALFATISGVLAGWGMNINNGGCLANAAGVVLDTFSLRGFCTTRWS